MLSILPNAGILHLGIFRDPSTKQPVEYYNKLPFGRDSEEDDSGKRACFDCCVGFYDCAILLDAMIATGGTATAAIAALRQWNPSIRIKILSIVGTWPAC